MQKASYNSFYTKSFYSDQLNDQKFDSVLNFANLILEQKNILSRHYLDHVLELSDLSKFNFITYCRANKENIGLSNAYSSSYEFYDEVYDAYQNKIDQIKKKIQFYLIKDWKVNYYLRKTKYHNKGDFKGVSIKRYSSHLSSTLTYLARYGFEGTEEHVLKRIKECKSSNNVKGELYFKIIKSHLDKFGFNRLYKLALLKRERILKQYSNPIVFKSLSFRGISRVKKVLDKNKNKKSIIKAFISLGKFNEYKALTIPVKLHSNYHGKNLDIYSRSTISHPYTIVLDDKALRERRLKINLTKPGDRQVYISEGESNCSNENTLGIDVNVKHNMLSMSNNSVLDYPRKEVNKLAKLQLKRKQLVSNANRTSRTYKLGKRFSKKIDAITKSLREQIKQSISLKLKELKLEGYNHLVMENLDKSFGKSFVKDNLTRVNFNDLTSVMNICDLKNIVNSLASKKGFILSLVHPEYTSKMCPVCGCIEDENRPDQETFCCISCGHKSNADFNAAINIRNRVTVDVLRKALLKQNKMKQLEPRNFKKEKVKEVLLKHGYALTERLRTEDKDITYRNF